MEIDIFSSLKAQRDQLERLLASPVYISNALKATPDEIGSQISQLRASIQELETLLEKQRS